MTMAAHLMDEPKQTTPNDAGITAPRCGQVMATRQTAKATPDTE
jgi:hypothetical protein